MELFYFDYVLRVIQLGRVINKKLVVNDDLNILLDDEDIITGLVINNLSAEN